jgi:ArsR family transcriptional regulator
MKTRAPRPEPDGDADRLRLLERSRVLKAMAHPSRLLILEALDRGERCVGDLQRIVGSDMSTVSKHLALLRSAGLLVDRREGMQVFYRLRVPCALRFFECVDAVTASTRPGTRRDPPAGRR